MPLKRRIPAATCSRPRHTADIWRACLRQGRSAQRTSKQGARIERKALSDRGGGQRHSAHGSGAGTPHARGLAPRRFAPDRHPRGLRARDMRRLLGHARRRTGAFVPHVRVPGGWPPRDHRRGPRAARRRHERAAGQLLPDARAAVRLLHARDADRGAGTSEHQPASDRFADSRGDRRQPVSLHRLSADRGRGAPRRRTPVCGSEMTMAQETSPSGFRYIGTKRRTKEDPRFVTGRGRYVADIALPGTKHVALVASPHPSARIVSISTDAALAAPGVLTVLTGDEFCARTDPLYVGVDAPKVTRYALARGVVRYAGEWVAAVVADTRALAEDAPELGGGEDETPPYRIA